MSELVPGQSLDQYQILDVVKRGGMATIFRACDTENGNHVALKVPYLQYESDPLFHQRFLREEQIGQRLNHHGIVKVLRPKAKSRVYFAMELIEGELLNERLRRDLRLPIATAVDFAIQIADTLVYLHQHDVVHRDLKPENVMVLPDRRIKLMDLGIALDSTLRKITWSGLSQPMGTPDYMAPEQVRGRRGDASSDLYSLGIILYEMLTGQVPFSGKNVYSIMRAKICAHAGSPRHLRSEVSLQLEETVLQALEADPRERHRSAADFRDALVYPERVILKNRAAGPLSKPRSLFWMQRMLGLIRGVGAKKI